MPLDESHAASGEIRSVDLKHIVQDHQSLQARVAIHHKTVEQYARSMKAGSQFPPVTLYEVEGSLFLVDGFHRLAALSVVAEANEEMQPKIQAEVIQGNMGQAMKAAALANTSHGRTLKRSDHRRAFQMLGKSGELEGTDSRSIADLMNNVISHVTIWKWANEDFPGLLEAKPKKGEKPDTNRERVFDPLSAAQVEQQAALSALLQASRLVHTGKVKDEAALHDVASMAKDILEKAVELGGDPDRDPLAGAW